MTQVDRVLAMLRHVGERGLNTVDFHGPAVIDGGKPILRLAARVNELREQGHKIRSRRQLNNTVTYELYGELGGADTVTSRNGGGAGGDGAAPSPRPVADQGQEGSPDTSEVPELRKKWKQAEKMLAAPAKAGHSRAERLQEEYAQQLAERDRGMT